MLWLCTLTTFVAFQMQKPTMGVIDPHALIAIEAKTMAKAYPNGNVPTKVLQDLAERLKAHVNNFAKEENLILLAKGAVWGGELPDFTDLMIERLEKE